AERLEGAPGPVPEMETEQDHRDQIEGDPDRVLENLHREPIKVAHLLAVHILDISLLDARSEAELPDVDYDEDQDERPGDRHGSRGEGTRGVAPFRAPGPVMLAAGGKVPALGIKRPA